MPTSTETVSSALTALDIKIMLATVPMLIFGERVAETAIIHARRDIQLAAKSPGGMIQQEIN